ncbi:type II secretion system protein [bacterium]|nr:type II secretion system protein [bacterium]
MKIEQKKQEKNAGFTLVEVLVVIGIASTIIGILSALLSHFYRGFAKGEESGILLQESGMFLATLRNDLINAALGKNSQKEQWSKVLQSTQDTLSFSVYCDTDGNVEPVIYLIDGKSVKRLQGSKKSKTLINGNLKSLNWRVHSEEFKGPALGTKQIWIDLDLTLAGKEKPGLKAKPLRIRTKMFPTRLIKQMNG